MHFHFSGAGSQVSVSHAETDSVRVTEGKLNQWDLQEDAEAADTRKSEETGESD